MSASAVDSRRKALPATDFFQRHQGVLIAATVLVVTFALLDFNLAHGFSYFDFSSTTASTTTLALAAIGETIIVIGGGLDLSVGAVISLTNCLMAAHMVAAPGSIALWTVLGLLAGTVTGLVNAVLVVTLRLPAIIVTLATMFIVEGLTLLVLEQPGGAVPPEFSGLLIGDAIPGILPTPALLLIVALLIWTVLRQTPLGTFIYAVGSDEEAARAKGVPVRVARFSSYVIGGSFYGAAGVFLTAQTGSGDPTVGPPMLLSVFVAVVLGGTTFAGGRGGCLGTVFGALILMLIINLLLVFNVPTYYSSVAEGALLIVAVLAGSVGRVVALRINIRPQRTGATRGARAAPVAGRPREDDTLPSSAWRRWLAINASTLRFVTPSYVVLVIVIVLTAVVFHGRVSGGVYLNSLLVLASFLAVLALGQGAVVISGGLDLSVPAVITMSGIVLAEWTHGSSAAAVWAIPLTCLLGAGVGAINGAGIAAFGIYPLIMTLAMNGVLEGLSLVYTHGTPGGSSPPALTWLMTAKLGGLTPIVVLLGCFVAIATLLLSRTVYGRRLYAVGSSQVVAFFSGVPVGSTLIATYALSGLCSALVGIMLVGFSGQAFNDIGDPYLLPAIAVVVIGGTAMTGGRGHYLGMLGGALLLTALTTLLTGLLMPVALRNVIFGIVILAAIVGLRERTS